MLACGATKREVLDARWEDFDLDRRLWRIPMTKLGRPRHVPMSDGVLRLLDSVPRMESPWVFVNPKTLRPFVSIFCAWDTARNKAGLADVRIHDLRHSFASLLINSGGTLYEVQHILGHTQVKTTQRYAHLSQDTLLAAANAATRALDPDNILDINYFQNAYTYDQFLDDFQDRVYYMERTAFLEQTLGRLQELLETQTKQLADLDQRMR